jgi:hypothetical protein
MATRARLAQLSAAMNSSTSSSLKSAGHHLVNEARKAITELQSCVVPLFNTDEDGKAQLLGSAIVIEVEGHIFLITAKHVLVDTAALKLTVSQAHRFRDAQPLKADFIGNQVQAERCKYVEFIGFPATKSKRSVKRFVLKRI